MVDEESGRYPSTASRSPLGLRLSARDAPALALPESSRAVAPKTEAAADAEAHELAQASAPSERRAQSRVLNA